MAEAGLQRFLEGVAKEQEYSNGNVDVQAVTSGGANYSSALYEVTISASPKEDLKLFVKVANIGVALRDGSDLFDYAFKTEYIFYTKLAVAFEELYNKHNVVDKERLYIPKYYGSKSERLEETIALENLSSRGFEAFDRNRTVDWDYASKSVEELAKFHALGLVYRRENREELEKMANNVFPDMWSHEEMRNTFLEQAVKMGTTVVKEEYRQRVKKYLDTVSLLDAVEKFWKSSDTGFLVHSDYRPSNLLHRYQNGKLEIVPVDYQTLHLGTLAADLMYFIWTASDSQFRQQHYHRLLEHYYKELASALQNLRYDVDDVYPRSIFEKELEDTKTLGLFIGLGMMSVLTVESEDAPKLDNFRNLTMKPNKRALERMNGVVEDYITWGIIK